MASETVRPMAPRRAIEHMNADHRDSVPDMARALGGCSWATDAELIAVDALGVEVLARGDDREETRRLAFDAPLTGAQQLRGATIALARRTHGVLAG